VGVQDRQVGGARVEPLAVVSAASAVTSIGHSGPATFAAARAGIAGTVATERFPRRLGGRPIAHSPVEGFADNTTPAERMQALALRGANELLRGRALRDPVPVLLVAPRVRPGWSEQDAEALASRLFGCLRERLDRSQSGLYLGGADAGLMAMRDAVQMMQRDRIPRCLVGGVDSLLDATLLDWLEALRRLPGGDDPSGMIPGEGASWLLLEQPGTWQPGDVLLTGLGHGFESAPWYEGEPTIGDGLTEAVRQASRAAGEGRSAIVMTDANGEDWKVREWTYAYIRNAEAIGEPLDLRHPASCWGDLGAAAGIALVGLASWVLRRWSEAGTRILVTASADTTPLRTACVLASSADGERMR
jgi:3-oxoacyl-[acyl-carrier-protein] synthase-1